MWRVVEVAWSTWHDLVCGVVDMAGVEVAWSTACGCECSHPDFLNMRGGARRWWVVRVVVGTRKSESSHR